MKKTGAIIGLIFSCIAFVVLCSIFTVLMSMDSLSNISFGFMSVSYENADSYSVGEADIEQSINALDIEWINGSVTVEVYSGDIVKIEETSKSSLDSEDLLRYRVEKGKLTVKPCKSMWFFGINKLPEKALTVYLPASYAEGLESLDIEVTSAEVSISDITAREIDLSTVSGIINAKKLRANEISLETISAAVNLECKASNLDYETVSGALTLKGELESIDGEAVSGAARLELSNTPRELDCEAVSGDIRIYLPENAEFGGRFETVSGDFNCEFTGKLGKNSFDCGKTSGYNFETVSGDIEIKRSTT